MRTGLRDSALRRVRSVAAGQRGVSGLAEAPAQEGTAWVGRGSRGEGVPSAKVSPWDCRASPGHLPQVPPYPPATCQGFDSQPSPISFPPRSVNPEGPGGQGGSNSPHSLAPHPPSCPRGKTHQKSWQNPPGGMQRPQRGIPLRMARARPSLVGFGGQERAGVMPHYGTLRGLSRYVPDLLLQPCLSCSSMQGGGEGRRRHRAGGTSPAFPRPTLPSVLMIRFNLLLLCFVTGAAGLREE